jgi:hypothetical protein
MEVSMMRHTTLFSHELPDLLVAMIALLITLIIWATIFAPMAI